MAEMGIIFTKKKKDRGKEDSYTDCGARAERK